MFCRIFTFDKKIANLYPQDQNLYYFFFYVEYCGRLFRVPITSKEFEIRIKQGNIILVFFVTSFYFQRF
jgi:hypothetical protein